MEEKVHGSLKEDSWRLEKLALEGERNQSRQLPAKTVSAPPICLF